MEFNCILGIIIVFIVGVIGCAICTFIQKPSLKKVNEWLLYAVALAEKELGSGTGQIKLRYVYDMFIVKFPFLSKIISFKTFSSLVDKALDNFKKMLDSNTNLQNYIQK